MVVSLNFLDMLVSTTINHMYAFSGEETQVRSQVITTEETTYFHHSGSN